MRSEQNIILLKFRKDSADSTEQKCELHKPGRTNINFDEIALNFKNRIPSTTFIQPFHSFQTFRQLKIIILSLEICEQLGNCRICFLSNEIWSNVNANSWTKNERKSSKELFLLILVSLCLVSLLRRISSTRCYLKLCFLTKSPM